MVDGVDSQALKMKRIQNSDPETPTHNKKQRCQKCSQEPIFKIYWSLPLSKHCADKEDALYEVNVSIEQARRSTQDKNGFAALVDRLVASATPS